MRRIRNIALWTGIVAYLVFSLSFTGKSRRSTICSKIQVRIVDSLRDSFVTGQDVKDFMYDLDLKILGEPVGSINTRRLESYLTERDEIRQTEVYFTANGNLHVEIDQRNPIVRVINKKGQSYYIDRQGAIFPCSKSYASHVLVATGEITENFEVSRTERLNCPEHPKDKKEPSICEVFQLARFIHESSFWEAQIEQLYRNDMGEYELVPRIGAHLILLGEFEDYREKFRNLKAFYKKGLNKVGWNQYLKINLKYDNQIICTKNDQNES